MWVTARSRKIRFEDDGTRDPDEPEKDTRLKMKPAVSKLQVMMLKMAGQEVPMVEEVSDASLGLCSASLLS